MTSVVINVPEGVFTVLYMTLLDGAVIWGACIGVITATGATGC